MAVRFVLLIGLNAALIAPCPAVAGVVFGNLGGTGTGGLSATGTAITQLDRFAQGFSTGIATARTLQSVSVGLFWDDSFPAPINVLVYSDVNNAPGSVIATSSPVNVQAKAIYTFPFANVPLAANTNYWIVPPDGLSWYLNAAATGPTEQNGSGYAVLGTIRSANGGTSWTTDATSSYSVSVAAVPEPAMAGVSLVALGLMAAGIRFARQTRREPRGFRGHRRPARQRRRLAGFLLTAENDVF